MKASQNVLLEEEPEIKTPHGDGPHGVQIRGGMTERSLNHAPNEMQALSESHLAHLKQFHIDDELIGSAAIRSINDAQAREFLGVHNHDGADLTGILFPYFHPISGQRVGARIRLDHPLPDDGGKYLSETGCRHLYFPPGISGHLEDVLVPVILIEAEKSALALKALSDRTGRRMLPVALGGCWGWRRTVGNSVQPDGSSKPETGPTLDLDMITWTGRRVILLFDSNAQTNAKVRQARSALAKELTSRGADIAIAELPAIDGVNGPDDFLAVKGDAATIQLLNSSGNGGFELVRLGDLLSEPADKIEWIVEDFLPAGGLSLWCAKPKVGKSTLLRFLALCIASGLPFLGRETIRGLVLYLALEEKRSEVRSHFVAMGATGEEEILIHAAHAPNDALVALGKLVERHKPALIVVDPLQKMMRAKDTNDYAQITLALEPFLIVARKSGAHVAVAHHAGKMERDEAVDSILGSTALFGGVDTAVILRKHKSYRTIATVGRYGVDMPETVLRWDPLTRVVSLAGSREEVENRRIASALLAAIAEHPQAKASLPQQVEGRLERNRMVLRTLIKAGEVLQSGSGKRGDPLMISRNPSRTHNAGPTNGKARGEEVAFADPQKDRSVPYIHTVAGPTNGPTINPLKNEQEKVSPEGGTNQPDSDEKPQPRDQETKRPGVTLEQAMEALGLSRDHHPKWTEQEMKLLLNDNKRRGWPPPLN